MATKVSSYLTKLGFRQLEHIADAANYNNETGGEYIVIRENTRIYLYDATSNTPIDNINVLPTSDGGTSRWISVGGSSMTQYKINYTFESYSNEIPLGMTVLSKANIFYVNIENTQILSTEFNLNEAKDTILLSKPFEPGVRTEVVIFLGNYQPDSRDYELLNNKPMINGITLVGNRSLTALGIQPAGDYATNTRVDTVESTLENKKADKATTLAGYNIGDAYTKTEVDNTFATHANTIYQNLISATNNIILTDSISIYSYTITGDVTFTFDTSSLIRNVPGKIITFELYLPSSTTVGTITWPESVKWLGGEVPSIEANSNYLLAFRSFDQGVNWIGNVQCYWS